MDTVDTFLKMMTLNTPTDSQQDFEQEGGTANNTLQYVKPVCRPYCVLFHSAANYSTTFSKTVWWLQGWTFCIEGNTAPNCYFFRQKHVQIINKQPPPFVFVPFHLHNAEGRTSNIGGWKSARLNNTRRYGTLNPTRRWCWCSYPSPMPRRTSKRLPYNLYQTHQNYQCMIKYHIGKEFASFRVSCLVLCRPMSSLARQDVPHIRTCSRRTRCGKQCGKLSMCANEEQACLQAIVMTRDGYSGAHEFAWYQLFDINWIIHELGIRHVRV